MIVVLMGVTGSGKTTVGKVLAKELGWKFYDADDYHPASNIEKMHKGIPLTDEDRKPWLQTLAGLIDDARDRGENIVLACSALKHAYQEYLRHHLDAIHYVCLCGLGGGDQEAARRPNRTLHEPRPPGQPVRDPGAPRRRDPSRCERHSRRDRR